jgi:hypothetical protein
MTAAQECSSAVNAEIDVGSEVDPGSVETCQDFLGVCGQIRNVCANMRALSQGSMDVISPVPVKVKRGWFGFES